MFCATSCTNDTYTKEDSTIFKNDNKSVEKEQIKSSQKEDEYFPIDTSIVEGLVLWNSTKTQDFFNKYVSENNKQKTYDIIIKNKNGTQNMKLTHLPGSDNANYRYIEIYKTSKELNDQRISSSVVEFITNTSIKLDMSIDSFCTAKKLLRSSFKNNTYIYDGEIGGLGYHAKYFFDDNLKLKRFEFGYDNP